MRHDSQEVKMAGVNPRMLQWARESVGYEHHHVAMLLHLPVGKVDQFENGSEIPTYQELCELATLYRRPSAIFFFPEPPAVGDYWWRPLRKSSIERGDFVTMGLLQTAKFLGTSTGALNRLMRTGELPYEVDGAKRRIRIDDAIRLFQARRAR